MLLRGLCRSRRTVPEVVMSLLALTLAALPLCIAGLFEPGNIGSSSGSGVIVPTAPAPPVSLQTDLSNPNTSEAWVFW
jgi:hypothetical protein